MDAMENIFTEDEEEAEILLSLTVRPVILRVTSPKLEDRNVE